MGASERINQHSLEAAQRLTIAEVNRNYRTAVSAFYDGVKQTLDGMPPAHLNGVPVISVEVVNELLDKMKTSFDKQYS